LPCKSTIAKFRRLDFAESGDVHVVWQIQKTKPQEFDARGLSRNPAKTLVYPAEEQFLESYVAWRRQNPIKE